MVEASSHADISYRDMWNIPPLHFGPVHPLSSDDIVTIKPKRHKSGENNDQVHRTLAKILPLNSFSTEWTTSYMKLRTPAEVSLDTAPLTTQILTNSVAEPGEGSPRPSSAKLPPFVEGLARALVAITRGVFLLIPMVLMTFITCPHYRLIIVSVPVLWFSTSLGVVSHATNQELLGATAAYTAVLVVYVGAAS
jgi:hypothetical protein